MLYFESDEERILSFITQIMQAHQEGIALFYNHSGNKQAYQLGVKHISALEFSGYAISLPSGKLRVTQAFILVDFENNILENIDKGTLITPIALKTH